MVVQGQVQLINCSEQPLPQLQGMNQNQKLFLDLTRSASRQGPCSNYVQPDPSPTHRARILHTPPCLVLREDGDAGHLAQGLCNSLQMLHRAHAPLTVGPGCES